MIKHKANALRSWFEIGPELVPFLVAGGIGLMPLLCRAHASLAGGYS